MIEISNKPRFPDFANQDGYKYICTVEGIDVCLINGDNIWVTMEPGYDGQDSISDCGKVFDFLKNIRQQRHYTIELELDLDGKKVDLPWMQAVLQHLDRDRAILFALLIAGRITLVGESISPDITQNRI